MTEEQRFHARNAAMAKVAYWDALRAFELSTLGSADDEWADKTHDRVETAIQNLAASAVAGDTATGYGALSPADIEAAFENVFSQ